MQTWRAGGAARVGGEQFISALGIQFQLPKLRAITKGSLLVRVSFQTHCQQVQLSFGSWTLMPLPSSLLEAGLTST